MSGKSFIKLGQAGIGTQTTTERTAGVSTATGTVTYDVTDDKAKYIVVLPLDGKIFPRMRYCIRWRYED